MNNVGFGANLNNNVYGEKKDDTAKVLAKGALTGAGIQAAFDLVEIGYAANKHVDYSKELYKTEVPFKSAFKEAWKLFKEHGNVDCDKDMLDKKTGLRGALYSKQPAIMENLKGYKRLAASLAAAAGIGAVVDYAISKFKD